MQPSESVLSKRMGKQLKQVNHHDTNNAYMRNIKQNSYGMENPNGIINLGTAFSYICEDILANQLKESDYLHTVSNEEPNFWHVPDADYGNSKLRYNIAEFFSRKFSVHPTIESDNLVVINGTTCGLDTLAHCIADEGDIILIPTPAYTYLYRNINVRALVEFSPVDLAEKQADGTTNFILTAKKVEDAIVKANVNGRVKGLLLVNPNNPLGDVYSEEILNDILDVCARFQIHVICDEIHSMTVFDSSVPFRSIASCSDLPDPARTHVLWSFSKDKKETPSRSDFCMPGARMAIIYSQSSEVIQSLRCLSCLFMVPNLEQKLCSDILTNHAFLETLFPAHLERLKGSHDYVAGRLKAMGVNVRTASSGFVLMADFSRFMDDTIGELQLLERFINAGVYITPGKLMYCSVPGWYRIVFSKPRSELKLAMDRLEGALSTK